MRSKLWACVAAAAAALAFTSGEAFAGSVLTAQLDGFNVSVGSVLTGHFDLTVQGAVGTNVATATGVFTVTGGTLAANFGGIGAVRPMSGILTNFVSTVTGTTGINTQPAFGGDIFAEADSYASHPSIWGGGSQYIRFDFGALRVDGLSGYALAGAGSTSTPVGKIYDYHGSVYTNFWMDRVTIIEPCGAHLYTTGDWLAKVTTHELCPPIPEPSSIAVGALMLLGAGAWTWRRRRR